MSAQQCPKCGDLCFSQAGYERHVARCNIERPKTRTVKIDFDNNPLTRVVEQARRECPNLYRALAGDMSRFQESATAHNAGNVLFLLVAIVCKEQSCTPREAILGMQQRITDLDERVAAGWPVTEPQLATAARDEEE